MKKPFLIVFFFALCLRVFAATETIDLSAQGFADGTQVSVIEGDAVKLTFTNGDTPTAYYTSGSAVRLYNGGTMTVTCDFTMSKIVFDYVLDGIATASVSQAIFNPETKTWEGSLSSVVLTAGTAMHVRIKSVTVTYESGSTSDEGGTYELVTSSTRLAAGDKCVVLDFEGGYAVGTIGGDAAAAISSGFTLTGTTVTIPSTTTDIAVFTLEASQTEGAFYLKSSLNEGKYLQLANSINVATSAKGVDLFISTSTDANNYTKIAFSKDTNRSLSYYPNNSFKNYATPLASGKYKPVKMYRKTSDALEPVTGIANFARTSDDTNVRLYLPDANDVRVLRVVDNGDGTVDAYVREHTSSDGYCGMVLRGLTPNRPLAYDQHIAGWISGVRATSADGQIEFVADASFTNTAFLVIADLVSEPLTAPNTITSDKLAEHNGDWVTLRELACSVSDGNLVLSDGAGDGPVALNAELASSGYAAPYAGAVVDVAGIASNNTLYPTTIGSVPQITYVVDTEAGYVSPSTSIANTAVRVKRQLIAGQWAPLTLPFAMDVDDFAGDVMAYQSLVDGGTITTGGKQYEVGTMVFEPAESIEAGVPYLVRPTRLITEITSQNGVTLAGGAAQSVSMTRSSGGQNAPGLRRIAATDEYSFVGVYESTAVPTDKTAKIFFADGTVGWATEDDNMVPSTSAYVLSPENQVARLQLGDASPTIITAIDTIEVSRPVLAEGIYNLLGMKLNKSWSELPHGIYIVNGVKRVK
jgi:hypothetical protein